MPSPCLEQFLASFAKRGVALLQDDLDNQHKAALVAPAKTVDEKLINEVLHYTGGHIFVVLSPARGKDFHLSRMARPQVRPAPIGGTNFLISVDAREGITTGISASDRMKTVNILGADIPNPRKLVRPGHIFPIEARPGGVLVKNALPEGALDLCKIAGHTDAALLIDLLDDSGELMSVEQQEGIAKENNIPTLSLSDLTRYRLETEQLVHQVAKAELPTEAGGELTSYAFKAEDLAGEHIALVKGEIDPTKPILTRVHSELTFSDVFGGCQPPSRESIQGALNAIQSEENGVFLYLRKYAKGHLSGQIGANSEKDLPKRGARMREYGVGAQILRELGVRKIILLTNSKTDLVGLQSFGLEIVEQRPIHGDCDSDKAAAHG